MKNYLKLAAIVLLMMCMLCCSVSCDDLGIGYRNSLDEDLHNQIEVVWSDNKPSYLIYQDEKYDYFAGRNYCDIFTTGYKEASYENDIKLSWNGNRNWGYINTYYSYSADSPVFIYETRSGDVFLREGFDYTKDTFVIGDTNSEFVFEDILLEKHSDVSFQDGEEVLLTSKQNPRLKLMPNVKLVDGRWYIKIVINFDTYEVWTVSDDFIEALKQNGII